MATSGKEEPQPSGSQESDGEECDEREAAQAQGRPEAGFKGANGIFIDYMSRNARSKHPMMRWLLADQTSRQKIAQQVSKGEVGKKTLRSYKAAPGGGAPGARAREDASRRRRSMAGSGKHGPHGSVYFGGLSRGDTPPKEIPTLGAAGGRPRERLKDCPYARDENARVLARHECMSRDVINKSDVPPGQLGVGLRNLAERTKPPLPLEGPVMFKKDYDRCLITEDLERAQPVLSHPTSHTGLPIPWKLVQKPAEPEPIPRSSPKAVYPPLRRRVQEGPDSAQLSAVLKDLSLRTSDIDYAQPKKPTIRPRKRSTCIVDLLTTSYQFASSEVPPQPPYRSSGRCPTEVSDIDGCSVRRHYRNLVSASGHATRLKTSSAAGTSFGDLGLSRRDVPVPVTTCPRYSESRGYAPAWPCLAALGTSYITETNHEPYAVAQAHREKTRSPSVSQDARDLVNFERLEWNLMDLLTKFWKSKKHPLWVTPRDALQQIVRRIYMQHSMELPAQLSPLVCRRVAS
eukprot:s2853_g2.t1